MNVELATVLLRSALAVGLAMAVLWLFSLRLRNASIVDPFWGTGFVLVSWLAGLGAQGPSPRRLLALALVTAWGARLSLHLLVRNWGKGEDPRYRAMRERHGDWFPLVSLFTVFAFQGVLLLVVSLPLQVAIALPGPPRLGALDLLGAGLWAVGFLFEAVGDWQLVRFREDPSSRGKALDTGLWRFTRHPNYFGDAVQWWGFGCLGLAAGTWWTLLSPAIMTFLLMKVSGVTLLEKGIAERRPGYRDYALRTNAFFPWFPRKVRS